MNGTPEIKNRICFLDEVRGFAVFCMVFYHAFYALGEFFGCKTASFLFDFFLVVEPFFAGIFIFVCGISCVLSRNNLKRGAILAAVAAGISVLTAVVLPALGFPGNEIYFGILHLLSVLIIFYWIFEKLLLKIPPRPGFVLCAVLYAAARGISAGRLGFGEKFSIALPDRLYESNLLTPLGFCSPSFFSADYFPIFPWIFVFLAGSFIGSYCRKNGFSPWTFKKRAPFFDFLGKNALIIYIVHLPAVCALAYCVGFITNLIKG